MSATVEPPAPPPVRLVSVEEYHQGPERNENGRYTELIRGVVVEKKMKSPVHSATVHRLGSLLRQAVGAGCFVRLQDPITMSDSEPEPDVAVIPGEDDDYFDEHPRTALLAVEISVTTLAADREKADLYAEANIPEYWLVRPERGVVEVYTQPRGGLYRERRTLDAAEGDTLTSTVLPGFSVALADLFRRRVRG